MFIRVLLIFVHKEATTRWLLTILQLHMTRWLLTNCQLQTRWGLYKVYLVHHLFSDISQYMLHIYSTLEIIKNQRGGLKLMHEGYMYIKNVRWECVNCYAFSYKGGLTLDAEVKIARSCWLIGVWINLIFTHLLTPFLLYWIFNRLLLLLDIKILILIIDIITRGHFTSYLSRWRLLWAPRHIAVIPRSIPLQWPNYVQHSRNMLQVHVVHRVSYLVLYISTGAYTRRTRTSPGLLWQRLCVRSLPSY